MEKLARELNERFRNSGPREVLAWFSSAYAGKIAFSTSLGAEDQAILHMIWKEALPVRVFTLDTGRMFQETYDLIDINRNKFNLPIEVYFPDALRVEAMVREKGINLFYESIENRQFCCTIRKIEPLMRALAGMEVWITGMRRNQSVTRTGAGRVEWEPRYGLLKLNPLIDWTDDELWSYLRENKVPVSELHQKGYPSIGCMPCTRPVAPGEDIRSGRWWWELPEYRECGLHNNH